MNHQVLRSAIDQSCNFVLESGHECRFVQRDASYFIVYLSSHNGCNRACRMCHLTQTKQTTMQVALPEDMGDQARLVLRHAGQNNIEVRKVHFNWMARGEPLDNFYICNEWEAVQSEVAYELRLSSNYMAEGVYNISTIMPKDLQELNFGRVVQPRLYYSLYSLRPEFRKRWLPQAMNPHKALEMLSEWQYRADGDVTLHWALIEGENDSLAEAEAILKAAESVKLRAQFNLVRYNPWSEDQGKEPNEQVIQDYFNVMSQINPLHSRIVPRVGPDVKASCGMFVER